MEREQTMNQQDLYQTKSISLTGLQVEALIRESVGQVTVIHCFVNSEASPIECLCKLHLLKVLQNEFDFDLFQVYL